MMTEGKHLEYDRVSESELERQLEMSRSDSPAITMVPLLRRGVRLLWLSAAPLLMVINVSGCLPHRANVGTLPSRFEVECDDLLIRSDLKINRDNEILSELKEIRRELVDLLELPPPTRPVVVYLFSDEERYSAYMQKKHPNLPPRRAFFIGSPTELGVYAHWSENVGEDLRHEYTHGILHSSLRTVPLWLDEGLAEYFEKPSSQSGRRHAEHSQRLAIALTNGWRPDLARLEQIEDVSQMRRADYQEAWAWIYYLLHEAPGGRELLVDYCKSLRKSDKAPRFHDQLARHFPDCNIRLTSYLSTTFGSSSVRWAMGQSEGSP